MYMWTLLRCTHRSELGRMINSFVRKSSDYAALHSRGSEIQTWKLGKQVNE